MQNSDSSIILDASAFYAGIPFLGAEKCYTTRSVFNEIKHIKKSFSATEALIDAGNLQIKEPDVRFIDAAKRLAQKSGDLVKMSKADISIIALALELEDRSPLIVTDDYAIANIAELSDIKVSYVMSKGITKTGSWIRYCGACGILYRQSEKTCRVCGNKLRSRLKRSQKH